tara:strand:+ start:2491 stop:3051 length:561 start_codon:yes stop_codon:yes gene_type:complete
MSRYTLKITGGTLRGRSLSEKGNSHIRPTSSRVREAIFNVLRDKIIGANVLDIYSGTGCLSLESISRGARKATLVEKDEIAVALIEKNFSDMQLVSQYILIKGASPTALGNLNGPYDLIFADPPYTETISNEEAIIISELLSYDGLFVYEHRSSYNPAEYLGSMKIVERRKYGESTVSYFESMESL